MHHHTAIPYIVGNFRGKATLHEIFYHENVGVVYQNAPNTDVGNEKPSKALQIITHDLTVAIYQGL